MTIKFHATFAVGSLLLLLSMHPAAKADTIHVVSETNYAKCADFNNPCFPVSFSADFATMITPDVSLGNAPEPFIESMTGALNGYPVVLEIGSWLLPNLGNSPNYIPLRNRPIYFSSNGTQYGISYDDEFAGSAQIFYASSGNNSYITWDATLVQTPEPSSLLLLLLGSGGLLVGLALFKNKSQTV
jgi:hypothetical protein